ncbi:hypothetical protein YB2330_004557 [Saitoella coloradoensis]
MDGSAWIPSLFDSDDGNGTDMIPPNDPRNFRFSPMYLGQEVVISFSLGALSFLLFCFLRPRWSGIYAARVKSTTIAAKLPALPDTLFSWILTLWRITDEQILDSAGLDAFVFLGFFKMSVKFLAVAAFIGMAVVAPVKSHFTGTWQNIDKPNSTSPDDGSDSDLFQFYTPTTLGAPSFKGHKDVSLEKEKAYLWMYAVFVYVFSALAAYFLIDQNKRFISIRQSYLGSQSTVTDRTITLSGIPRELRSEEAITKLFHDLKLGAVESVTICRKWKELDQLMEERMGVMRKLEECYSVWKGREKGRVVRRDLETLPLVQPDPPVTPRRRSDPTAPLLAADSATTTTDLEASASTNRHRTNQRPRIKLGLWSLFGKPVDAIDHYTAHLHRLDSRIAAARSRAYPATPIAFVTFTKVSSAQVAAQSVLDGNPLRLHASLAPAPGDVAWSNTYLSRRERLVRNWSITLLIAFFVVFWVFPVSGIATLLNEKTLRKFFPAVADLLDGSRVGSALVQGFLPTLAFTIFNGLVPFFFDWVSGMQGYISAGDVELAVISKHYFFLFFNFFLVFTVAGTASNFYAIAKDTTKFAYLLAQSLPNLGPFYVNFIVLQGIGMFPFRLLEFGSVALFPIYKVGCKTPRDLHELKQPPTFNYGFFLPQPILILVISLVYSIMNPLVLVFALIYFILGLMVYKYQLLYAMDHPQHSTGKAISLIFNRVVIGMILFQVTMIGILLLQGAFTISVLLLPAPVATLIMAYNVHKTFYPQTNYIALRSIQENIQHEHHLRRRRSRTLDEERESGQEYVHPHLRGDLEGVWVARGRVAYHDLDNEDEGHAQ